MWRFLVFKVFAARTVCKKQEQKYRTVSKNWLEIPYGVCVLVEADGEQPPPLGGESGILSRTVCCKK